MAEQMIANHLSQEAHNCYTEAVANHMITFDRADYENGPNQHQRQFQPWKHYDHDNSWCQAEVLPNGAFDGRVLRIVPQQGVQITCFQNGKIHGKCIAINAAGKVKMLRFDNGEMKGEIV